MNEGKSLSLNKIFMLYRRAITYELPWIYIYKGLLRDPWEPV